LEATNWPAEHEMRVVARIRKSCAGNRTERGARTTSVLLSVLRTAIKRNVDIPYALDALAGTAYSVR
jgi:hypothetical protein